MRILFVAYCMINNENGDSLIGVYKRSLRIGLEMARRGHEVWIFCTGREAFSDATTLAAAQNLKFLDVRLDVLFSRSVELRRRYYRLLFRRLRPDMVVAGEVPLAGSILDSSVCAAGLGIPVVVLDNAYSPDMAELFVASHGAMADAVVLTGPSSFHMQRAPSYYCAAPPFVQASSETADALLSSLGLTGKRLITVLAYERKAETLAAALLAQSAVQPCEAVFLTAAPRETEERLAWLPAGVRRRVRALTPPAEGVLFSLLHRSSLVVGKCGFMQVSESLALGTPFIGIDYRGCFPVDTLPPKARKFVHATRTVEPDRETVKSAAKFLKTSSRKLRKLHDGQFGGVRLVADFLEAMPRTPRADTTAECARLGYAEGVVSPALERLTGRADIRMRSVRSTRLRNLDGWRIDNLSVIYECGGAQRHALLWGRRYEDPDAARQDLELARRPDSPRRLLHYSPASQVAIEVDIGEPYLPPAH
jgi:hypothetical protein